MEVNFGNELWFFLTLKKKKSISCADTVTGDVTKQQVLSEPDAFWVFWDVEGGRGAQLALLAMALGSRVGLRWPLSLEVTGQGITQAFSLCLLLPVGCWSWLETFLSVGEAANTNWGVEFVSQLCRWPVEWDFSHYFQSYSSQFRWFSIQLTLEALFSTLQDSALKKLGKDPCAGMCYLRPKCRKALG